MARKKVYPLTVGWQWRILAGADDHNGQELPGSAGVIRGGWAATEAAAHDLADAALAEVC